MSFLLILNLRYVRSEAYDTRLYPFFFVVRNLYGSLINLKKIIYNTTGRKTDATTAPSVLILHSIHCCYCCSCWACGPLLDTVKTLMFNNKFFKFRLLHSLLRFFASIKRIPFFIFFYINWNRMYSIILNYYCSNYSKHLTWLCFVQFEYQKCNINDLPCNILWSVLKFQKLHNAIKILR